MKDAVKRTINNVKLYFRRRKLLKDVMRQWADSLIMQQDTLRMQQQPSINQVPLVAVPAPQPIQTAEDAAIAKSVDELVFAIDQEAAAASQAPFARQDPMLAAINRRIGVN
jgi:hypothetical protein